MIHIGIIGAGRIGRIHAAHIQQGIADARVQSISDAYLTEESRKWAQSLGIPGIYSSSDQMLEKERLDAIIISSPTPTHVPIIQQGAARNLYVFCEKPLAETSAAIDQLMETLPPDAKLQIGFNRRFDHNFRRVKEQIAAGSIGSPRIISIISQDPELPPPSYFQSSEGLFMGTSIHDFDMLRFISDSEVARIQVMTAAFDPFIQGIKEIDSALISLQMENGCLAQITNSWSAVYGYDQRLEIVGSKGMLSVENDRPTTVKLATKTHTAMDSPQYFFQQRYAESYLQELVAFITAVKERGQVPVTAKDGLMSVLIAEAAELSRKENRPVFMEKRA